MAEMGWGHYKWDGTEINKVAEKVNHKVRLGKS